MISSTARSNRWDRRKVLNYAYAGIAVFMCILAEWKIDLDSFVEVLSKGNSLLILSQSLKLFLFGGTSGNFHRGRKSSIY